MKWYWWLFGAGALYLLLKPSEDAGAEATMGPTGGGEVLIGPPTLVVGGVIPPGFMQKLVAFYTASAQRDCVIDLSRPDKFCCPQDGIISALVAPNGIVQIVCVTKTGKFVVDQFASLAEAYNQLGYLFK